jgi:hypothetical protein
MSDEQKRKCQRKPKAQTPKTSNDQLGENAGEGRLMKDSEKKGRKKL